MKYSNVCCHNIVKKKINSQKNIFLALVVQAVRLLLFSETMSLTPV